MTPSSSNQLISDKIASLPPQHHGNLGSTQAAVSSLGISQVNFTLQRPSSLSCFILISLQFDAEYRSPGRKTKDY